jgi:hypothetical protein
VKWKKLGRLFDPGAHRLPSGCRSHAQAPQALVLPDVVRIFFSTREPGADGEFVSRVAYVDMDHELRQVLDVSATEVIPLGGLGTFDEHGIFPLNVLQDGDSVLGFIGGWSRRVAVPVDGAIGLARSRDGGRTFERLGPGPVMAATLQEPFMVGDPFVLRHEGLLHMWYIFGTRWLTEPGTGAPERVYKIAHATSPDGRRWQRDAKLIVPDRLGPDECQALPTVFARGGRFHMHFCYREAFGFRTDRTRAYRIGYCHSDDLLTWTRDDAEAGIDVTEGAWDSDMMCYPHVFTCGERQYLLYNGNEFGRHGFGAAVAVD